MDMENYDYGFDYGYDYESPQMEVHDYVVFMLRCAAATWIVLANTILIVALAKSDQLKKETRFWLLINLAVANLLVGALVLPFSIYLEVMSEWELGKVACYVWILTDVLVSCVSMFTLLSINIDLLVFVTKPLTYYDVMRKPICFAMLLFTWLLGLAVALPLVFFKQVKSDYGQCYVDLAPFYALGSTGVSYFFPGLIVFLINISTLCIVAKKTRTKRRTSFYLDKSQEQFSWKARGQFVMASMVEARERASRDTNRKLKYRAGVITLVNVFYLAMWLPFYLLNVLLVLNLYKGHSPVPMGLWLWLGYANSGLNPLLWLNLPGVRRALARLCCCCCGNEPRSESEAVLDDTATCIRKTVDRV